MQLTFQRLAEAEIEQAHALLADHHVAGLHVAMHDAARMGVRQGIEQRQHDFAQLVPGQAKWAFA
ncbi:hypothetical protein D3C76_1569100 [compost metagenome]